MPERMTSFSARTRRTPFDTGVRRVRLLNARWIPRLHLGRCRPFLGAVGADCWNRGPRRAHGGGPAGRSGPDGRIAPFGGGYPYRVRMAAAGSGLVTHEALGCVDDGPAECHCGTRDERRDVDRRDPDDDGSGVLPRFLDIAPDDLLEVFRVCSRRVSGEGSCPPSAAPTAPCPDFQRILWTGKPAGRPWSLGTMTGGALRSANPVCGASYAARLGPATLAGRTREHLRPSCHRPPLRPVPQEAGSGACSSPAGREVAVPPVKAERDRAVACRSLRAPGARTSAP
jgi:hypothetical protein